MPSCLTRNRWYFSITAGTVCEPVCWRIGSRSWHDKNQRLHTIYINTHYSSLERINLITDWCAMCLFKRRITMGFTSTVSASSLCTNRTCCRSTHSVFSGQDLKNLFFIFSLYEQWSNNSLVIAVWNVLTLQSSAFHTAVLALCHCS